MLQSEPGGGPTKGGRGGRQGRNRSRLNQPIREQNRTRGLPAHRDYCEAAVTRRRGMDNDEACFQSARLFSSPFVLALGGGGIEMGGTGVFTCEGGRKGWREGGGPRLKMVESLMNTNHCLHPCILC